MNEQQWIEKLEQEGFKEVRVCPINVPNNFLDTHTHEQATAHVILEGELTLVDEKGTQTLRPGDFFEIPAGTTHTAEWGPSGCRFIVGIKEAQ